MRSRQSVKQLIALLEKVLFTMFFSLHLYSYVFLLYDTSWPRIFNNEDGKNMKIYRKSFQIVHLGTFVLFCIAYFLSHPSADSMAFNWHSTETSVKLHVYPNITLTEDWMFYTM